MSYKFVKNIGRNHSSRASYGYGSKITGITVHHWGSTGQKFANVVSWLRGYTGNRGSSAHYVVQDGRVEQLVEDSRASWHGGNNKANGTTIGIECRPEMTAGDWATLVELCVNLEAKHGSMKYYGHKDWKNTACPGDYYPRLGELVKAVNAYKKSGKVPSTTGGSSSGGGASRSYKTVSYGTTLGKYDKGSPVKDWQDFLVGQGHKLKDGVDGYFGDDTVNATKAYQKSVSVEPDGMAGKDTWAKAVKDGLKWKRKKAAPKAPAKSKAPKFPLPSGHWYGMESSNAKNHSGYYSKDRPGIKKFQAKLKSRGWTISADGRFGSQTKKVVGQFQAEKRLSKDFAVGVKTWKAIWESPVT